MKKKNIVSYTMDEILKMKDDTDWARIDKMRDADIDTSDIPELTEEFWKNAKRFMPPKKKKMISLRMDEELIKWFKRQGVPYQSLMQSVLKAYAETHKG